MPDIKDIVTKRSTKKAKFSKKAYRPWDLSGTGEHDTKDSEESQDAYQSVDNKPANEDKDNSQLDLPSTDSQLDSNQITNREQLDSNKITNKEQSGNNQITNREQLDSNQITNREQLDSNQITNREQFREHTSYDYQANSLYNRILKLSGVQRDILEFLTEICLINNSNETGPIETTLITQNVKTTYGTVKTSIRRLVDKELIERKKGKTAKGGYINLIVYEQVRKIILAVRNKTKPQFFINDKENILSNSIDNKKDIVSNHSSSNYINTTTTDNKSDDLPEEWNNITFDALSDIGFSKTQIKQLYKLNITTPEIVQESINHFAFGIQYNDLNNKYSKPLNVLMGVLRKGEGWIEPNYKSPKEIAQEQFLEQKKKERERMKKLEQEAFELAFNEWHEQLTEHEKTDIGGTDPEYKNQRIVTPEDRIKDYFTKKVWPDKKNEYLVSSG
jgi:predicted transcriptional regulator